MRVAQSKDVRQYLLLFARHYAGDDALADEAIDKEEFSLEPIQKGTFDYGGRDEIARVVPVRLTAKLYGRAGTVITVPADDIRDAYADDLGGLTLDTGVMSRAWLRFYFNRIGRRTRPVTVEIAPPSSIRHLRERWYYVPVLNYLQSQGVKLTSRLQ